LKVKDGYMGSGWNWITDTDTDTDTDTEYLLHRSYISNTTSIGDWVRQNLGTRSWCIGSLVGPHLGDFSLSKYSWCRIICYSYFCVDFA